MKDAMGTEVEFKNKIHHCSAMPRSYQSALLNIWLKLFLNELQLG